MLTEWKYATRKLLLATQSIRKRIHCKKLQSKGFDLMIPSFEGQRVNHYTMPMEPSVIAIFCKWALHYALLFL